MKHVRGSRPASGQQSDKPSSSAPPADPIQRILEQQIQMIEQQQLDLQKLTQQTLDAMRAEFDALLGRMQTAAARAGMQRTFNASPEQLGKAAVDAARKRG